MCLSVPTPQFAWGGLDRSSGLKISSTTIEVESRWPETSKLILAVQLKHNMALAGPLPPLVPVRQCRQAGAAR